jgi:hypothetical protein
MWYFHQKGPDPKGEEAGDEPDQTSRPARGRASTTETLAQPAHRAYRDYFYYVPMKQLLQIPIRDLGHSQFTGVLVPFRKDPKAYVRYYRMSPAPLLYRR